MNACIPCIPGNPGNPAGPGGPGGPSTPRTEQEEKCEPNHIPKNTGKENYSIELELYQSFSKSKFYT